MRRQEVERRSRLERAEQLGVTAAALARGQPLRQVAAGLAVARSPLRRFAPTVHFHLEQPSSLRRIRCTVCAGMAVQFQRNGQSGETRARPNLTHACRKLFVKEPQE